MSLAYCSFLSSSSSCLRMEYSLCAFFQEVNRITAASTALFCAAASGFISFFSRPCVPCVSLWFLQLPLHQVIFFVFGGKAIPSFQHNSSMVAPFKLGLMRLIRPPAIHANTPRNYRLRIPTDRRQTPWLCSSAAEELTQGLQKQIHLIVRAGLELRNFRFQVLRLNHAVSFYEGILFGELTKKCHWLQALLVACV